MEDSNLKIKKTTSGAHGSAGRADCLPRRKPPACIGVRQLCRKKIRCWGLGTPTTAGESRQLQCPKVPKARTESPLVRPQAHTPCPGWGMTRRLRRGSGTCRPMGRSHFSFDGERKVCKRKPAARRLQRRPTSLCAVGFGLREPNGWMPRIYSGHPIPALRPEQSDHVPWADCPQGLSSTSARCAHPPGKSPLMPILTAGLATSRAI